MEAKSTLVKCFPEKKCNFNTFTYYDVTIKILFEMFFQLGKIEHFLLRKLNNLLVL